MGYSSSLNTLIRATPEQLFQCLEDFNNANADKRWAVLTCSEIGDFLTTRLLIRVFHCTIAAPQPGLGNFDAQEALAEHEKDKALYRAYSEFEYQWEIVELDITNYEGLQYLGYISANKVNMMTTEIVNILSLNFWPDWHEQETPPAYLEYLVELFKEFQRRGMIKDFPVWLKEEIQKRTIDSLDTESTFEDSGHYAYPPEKRREIVSEYRRARAAGDIGNKNSWALANHGISGKTLLKYEREFPKE